MSNPKTDEARQAYIDQDPFKEMKISDNSILDKLEGRHPCPRCGKSRKFFCYSCYVPIKELEGYLPKVKLPFKIDIIKHKNEIDGKSTAAHAAILAPYDISIYTYPEIPDYNEGNVILVFPSQKAVSVSTLIEQESYEDTLKFNDKQQEIIAKGFNRSTLLKKLQNDCLNRLNVTNSKNVLIKKAIFIDSTWNQSKGIYKDPKLKNIPCVVIQNRVSQFWRHQKGSPRWYLATIEAIHQFLIEIHLHSWGLNPDYKGIYNCFNEKTLQEYKKLYKSDSASYDGQYDNLLYFFRHMYDLIHAYYDHDNLHAYKRRLL